jgi:hypothetical protein
MLPSYGAHLCAAREAELTIKERPPRSLLPGIRLFVGGVVIIHMLERFAPIQDRFACRGTATSPT